MNEYNKNIKMLFWNSRSIRQRKYDLPILLLQDIDILVCVETRSSTDDPYTENFQISGFQTVRKDRIQTRGGGILFFVRNYLDFFLINGNYQ